jgi:hypothetical protein
MAGAVYRNALAAFLWRSMPKNIILLSDGTGNAAGKLLKTNVWRLYESLDLRDPSVQIACYDDGVGTSSFKPLALIGGGFGYGLKRNVLRLYRFLCEHYDPGDRIYAFGFSRGAFTIRVLVGLISTQGIIKTRLTSPLGAIYGAGLTRFSTTVDAALTSVRMAALPEAPEIYGLELARLAKEAYREFRRTVFRDTSSVFVKVARWIRDGVQDRVGRLRHGNEEYERRRYTQAKNHAAPEIEFLGLWDTVDAYGLPVDELTDGINRWVWPLFAPDYELSGKVKKACHVLAIDDERNTFHPVLWDESRERVNGRSEHVDEERISQVWFAGMHANVGGGYPDDALAHVSLEWIANEAAKTVPEKDRVGVLFVDEVLSHYTKKADVFGRIYDSRDGIKGYYRYNPRRIEFLTNGQKHETEAFGDRCRPPATVTVSRPKIHESVFARIAAAPEAYAPIIFPENYAIVTKSGEIRTGLDNIYETDATRHARAAAQEKVWNFVWVRRLVYFATVAATIAFAALPLTGDGSAEITAADRTIVSGALSLVAGNFTSIPQSWIGYYAVHPVLFCVLGVAILGMMRVSRSLQFRIRDEMRRVWSHVIPPHRNHVEGLNVPAGIHQRLSRLRMHPVYQGAFAFLRHVMLPNVFGLVTLVAIALCALGVANRAAFEAANVFGTFCAPPASLQALAAGESRQVTFAASDFCASTGIRLDEGARYDLTFTRIGSPAGVNALSRGVSLQDRVTLTALAPFRRMWSVNWFVPVGRIGESGVDQYALTQMRNEFTARKTGELRLFVNDAVAPLKVSPFEAGWRTHYTDNVATVGATITRLP